MLKFEKYMVRINLDILNYAVYHYEHPTFPNVL
jgi:hypothetical protein